MNASNPETIYTAGSGDWTQARLITVSGLARTVPMSHRDNRQLALVLIAPTHRGMARLSWPGSLP